MPFPKREYYTIKQVAERWGTDTDQVLYSIYHDGLEACCWFDEREVDYFEFKGADAYRDLMEGYAGISAQQCRRIFRPGDIHVRSFYVLDSGGSYFRIPRSQEPALIHPSEVFIRSCACKTFEAKFDLVPTIASVLTIQNKHDFFLNGNLLSFGPVQEQVIRMLIEALKTGDAWVNGKTLLHKAGSQAPRLRDLFKGNAIWKELIQSDKRGHYRLRENITVEYTKHKEKAA